MSERLNGFSDSRILSVVNEAKQLWVLNSTVFFCMQENTRTKYCIWMRKGQLKCGNHSYCIRSHLFPLCSIVLYQTSRSHLLNKRDFFLFSLKYWSLYSVTNNSPTSWVIFYFAQYFLLARQWPHFKVKQKIMLITLCILRAQHML